MYSSTISLNITNASTHYIYNPGTCWLNRLSLIKTSEHQSHMVSMDCYYSNGAPPAQMLFAAFWVTVWLFWWTNCDSANCLISVVQCFYVICAIQTSTNWKVRKSPSALCNSIPASTIRKQVCAKTTNVRFAYSDFNLKFRSYTH